MFERDLILERQREGLNESPSEKEGKWAYMHSEKVSAVKPQ